MTVRNTYLDIVKYVVIFLVIWGHIIQRTLEYNINAYSDWIYQIIYSFHMPLFMGMCGFFFHKSLSKYGDRYIREKLCTRIKSLLYPMISFGILQIVTLCILNGFEYDFSIKDLLNKIHGVWFLGDLLINSLIVLAIYKYCKGNFLNDLLLFFLGAPFSLVPIVGYGSQGLFMYIFFVGGYCISAYMNMKKLIFIRKYRCLAVIVFIVLTICFNVMPWEPQNFFLTLHVENFAMMIFVDILKILLGFLGSFLVLDYIHMILPYVKGSFAYKRAIEWGQKTLDIYLLNIIVIDIGVEKIYDFVVSKDFDFIYKYGLVGEFFFTFICSVIFMEIIIIIGGGLNKNKIIAKMLFFR